MSVQGLLQTTEGTFISFPFEPKFLPRAIGTCVSIVLNLALLASWPELIRNGDVRVVLRLEERLDIGFDGIG